MDGRPRHSFLCSLIIPLLLSVFPLAAAMARADVPRVQFDVSPLVGCRDVTPAEFKKVNPDEKLVEARFEISSLIGAGEESDLLEYLYHIVSCQRTIQVVDYLPKTTLATDVVGSIGIDNQKEKTQSLGLSLKGHFQDVVDGSVSGSAGKRNAERVQYERMPPLELLSASGTIHRGAGAYFKLKPSPRTSLEGAKEFVLVLRVPATWRGDYVRIECRAIGYRRGVVRHLDELTTCGQAYFSVALFAEGDVGAKAAAQQLVRGEQQFRDAVAAHQKQIQEGRYPTRVHKLGSLFSVVEPKIPDSWFTQMLNSPPDAQPARYTRYLPAPVRDTSQHYKEAKKRLHQLNGQSTVTANSADENCCSS